VRNTGGTFPKTRFAKVEGREDTEHDPSGTQKYRSVQGGYRDFDTGKRGLGTVQTRRKGQMECPAESRKKCRGEVGGEDTIGG